MTSKFNAIDVITDAGYTLHYLLFNRPSDFRDPLSCVTAAGSRDTRLSRVVRVRVQYTKRKGSTYKYIHVYCDSIYKDPLITVTAEEYADQIEAHRTHSAWLESEES